MSFIRLYARKYTFSRSVLSNSLKILTLSSSSLLSENTDENIKFKSFIKYKRIENSGPEYEATALTMDVIPSYLAT